MVAGEDAEAAGVLRQDLGDAEFGGEVRDGGGGVGAQALVPAGLVKVAVKVLGGGPDAVHHDPGPRPGAWNSSRLTRPRKLTGSCSLSSHIRGFRLAKSSRVGRCQDQRRLVANRASGRIGSGRTVLTVNLRIAFTCATLTDNLNSGNCFGFLLGK